MTMSAHTQVEKKGNEKISVSSVNDDERERAFQRLKKLMYIIVRICSVNYEMKRGEIKMWELVCGWREREIEAKKKNDNKQV